MELPQEFAIATAPEGLGESTFEVVPIADELDGLEFRRTLGMFATGVTVISTLAREQIHGMTANAFMSVSLQPPLILISVDRRAKMMLDDLKMSVELGTPEHVGELFRLWGAITSASLGWIKNLIARLEAGEYVMADDAGSAFGAPPAGIPQ